MLQPGMPQATKRRMRFGYWITKATDTRTEYVILIAFPGQKWLHVRTSILYYAHIVFLVFLISIWFTFILQKLKIFN